MYTFIRVIKVLKFIFLVSAGTNILNKCNTIVVGHLGKQNSLYRFPGFKLGPKCQDVWFGLKHGLEVETDEMMQQDTKLNVCCTKGGAKQPDIFTKSSFKAFQQPFYIFNDFEIRIV